MAQHTAYFQDSYGGQHGPVPQSPTQYVVPHYSNDTRRSSLPESTATMYYSGLGGYGVSSQTQNIQTMAILNRSRSSAGPPYQSSCSVDYPRTHPQPPPSHTPMPWNGQPPNSYGYTQVPASTFQSSSWSSSVSHSPQQLAQPSYPPRADRQDRPTQYMGMINTTTDRNLGRSIHYAASSASPSTAISPPQSPQQWAAGPLDAAVDSPSMYAMLNVPNTDTPLRISPTGMPLSGYTFSPGPSPSSSPSPSQNADISVFVGSRRPSVDNANGVKKCSHCHATSTPLWRRNPTNMLPLCNACGLYLQQRRMLRPQELIDASAEDGETTDESDRDPSGPECSHCQTHVTSVWRRSKTGEQLCNACGVYLRLRGKPRPLSLKQKRIKPRPHSSKHATK
ncbi:hypothetical protein AX17_006095 [Amanita inopinata Kibby_2008]|nr:hypothetical protein AX17_006095 [Amanita inopinata Kibby_2008]